MRHIFVLLGGAGSGKDTAAAALNDCHRVAFADSLKGYVSQTYSIDIDVFHNVKKKDQPLIPMQADAKQYFAAFCNEDQHMWTPRDLLLMEGAMKRGINPNFWTDRVVKQIQSHPGHVVVTDCRFGNEMQALRRIPFSKVVTIRIQRVLSSAKKAANGSQANSLTESYATDAVHDYIIYNDTSVDKLQEEIQLLVAHILAQDD